MAKKNKYEYLENHILEMVGGRENVSFFTHCVTRLRFNLKDKGLVNIDEIEKCEGVIGAKWFGEQLQIIIGQNVRDVYNEICNKYGFTKEKSIEENLDSNLKKKFSFKDIITAISGCITPLLPMLVGGGMIRVILILGNQSGVLTSEMPTYVTLNYIADASLYFLPVAIGYTGAKKFGMNIGIGILLGGILIHPSFISNVNNEVNCSIFGLTIAANTYSSSVFPMILTTFVGSYVEKYLNKYSPNVLKAVLVPTVTLLIMTPLMLVVLAPIGSYLGVYLAEGLIWLYNTVGPLGVAIYSAFSSYLLVVGMHTILTPFATQAIASMGYDPIVGPAKYVRDFNLGTIALVSAIKDKRNRSMNLSYFFTAFIGGVTEPALFGAALKYKRAMLSVVAGGFVGGLYMGFLNVGRYVYGSSGIFGLAVFVAENPMNFVHAMIGIGLGILTTFICGMIFVKAEELV